MPKWGGSAFPQHPGLSPPGDARLGQVLHTSLCPGAVPRCNPPPQSMSPAYLSSQEPAAPRGFSEGGDLHLQGWLRAGTLTLGAESCFLFFSHPFPPGTATGTVFPALGRGQLLATAIPQGCREEPVGAGPRPGQRAWPRGGSGPAGTRLPALLGQRMQKAGVCCRHRFPFMALLPPSLELGDW